MPKLIYSHADGRTGRFNMTVFGEKYTFTMNKAFNASDKIAAFLLKQPCFSLVPDEPAPPAAPKKAEGAPAEVDKVFHEMDGAVPIAQLEAGAAALLKWNEPTEPPPSAVAK